MALNPEGITRFPIQEGEKISVELEEKPSERRLVIRGISRMSHPGSTHYVYFENNSAVEFTGSKYLDLREKTDPTGRRRTKIHRMVYI